ncbi:hypothetical protein L917_18721 [Phytophthora nicotianae]|uniref:FLYWCH-type domain-containing protein n=1 Tax=Phytophthora nicotianae TaxID=4792 RepID=W2K6M3_PHYNI|nr:hypothetical protein L917_18721 [Phytophthora nicotianae]
MTRHSEEGTDSRSLQRPTKKSSKKRDPKTKIIHMGFEYTRAWSSHLKIVFRCSVYRSTGCKARLAIRPTTSGYELVNMHTCVQPTSGTGADIVDCTTAMKLRVDSLSVLDLTKPVHEMW